MGCVMNQTIRFIYNSVSLLMSAVKGKRWGRGGFRQFSSTFTLKKRVALLVGVHVSSHRFVFPCTS